MLGLTNKLAMMLVDSMHLENTHMKDKPDVFKKVVSAHENCPRH